MFAGALSAVSEGLPQDARLAKLKTLAKEIEALEREEERIIDSSDGTIDRRPDARPDIILAA